MIKCIGSKQIVAMFVLGIEGFVGSTNVHGAEKHSWQCPPEEDRKLVSKKTLEQSLELKELNSMDGSLFRSLFYGLSKEDQESFSKKALEQGIEDGTLNKMPSTDQFVCLFITLSKEDQKSFSKKALEQSFRGGALKKLMGTRVFEYLFASLSEAEKELFGVSIIDKYIKDKDYHISTAFNDAFGISSYRTCFSDEEIESFIMSALKKYSDEGMLSVISDEKFIFLWNKLTNEERYSFRKRALEKNLKDGTLNKMSQGQLNIFFNGLSNCYKNSFLLRICDYCLANEWRDEALREMIKSLLGNDRVKLDQDSRCARMLDWSVVQYTTLDLLIPGAFRLCISEPKVEVIEPTIKALVAKRSVTLEDMRKVMEFLQEHGCLLVTLQYFNEAYLMNNNLPNELSLSDFQDLFFPFFDKQTRTIIAKTPQKIKELYEVYGNEKDVCSDGNVHATLDNLYKVMANS